MSPRAKKIRLTPPPRIEAIPPEGTAASTKRRPARWIPVTVSLFLGCALVVVFVLLPRWVAQRDASASQTPVEAVAVADAPALHAEEQSEQDRARLVLQEASQLQELLRSRGVAEWAPERYQRASELMNSGRDSFARADSGAAAQAFGRALDSLRSLEQELPQALEEALDTGETELGRGNSAAAIAAYQLAATIEPGNPAAAAGLRRAGVSDQLLLLLGEAETAKRRGELSRAAELYRRASALDPLSDEARRGALRVAADIETDAYSEAMSEGLDALDDQDCLAAQEAFRRAAALRPGSRGSSDGLARVEECVRTQAILEHRQRAQSAEESEQWHEAFEVYEAVLEIDATLSFAQLGKERAELRADLAERIDFHLERPGRLSSPEVLEEATSLLDEALGIESRGPVLSDQIARLQRTITIASTPVRVELVSDNLTEIVVHHVGKLGAFYSRSLELRPGTYTVVGTRQGYRDVRLQLIVKPEPPTEAVVVRCEQEI
jgi:hypothetical protein